MGLYVHKKIGSGSKEFFNAGLLASLFFLFAISILFLSFKGSETTSDNSNSFWNKVEIVAFNLHQSTKGISDFTNQDRSFNSSTISSRGYFQLEEVPGKYKVMKAVFDEHEIILRPDRIEILTMDAVEESAYFVFEKSNLSTFPEGKNLISTDKVTIKNAAMSRVLGAKSMNVSKFKEVVYNNVYSGVNMIVRIENDALQVELDAPRKTDASAFKMKMFTVSENANVSQDRISLAKSKKSINIKSDNSMLKSTSKGFKFDNPSASSDKLMFEISIK